METLVKPTEYFKQKAKEKNITRWNIHDCGMCGYKCGYVIRGEDISYDNGCGCSWGGERPADWNDLADQYNRNLPENNPGAEGKEWLKEMIEFWS